MNKLALVAITTLGLLFFTATSQQASAQNRGKVVELTDKTFKSEISAHSTIEEWKFIGKKPALIDFYANWCGPCKRLAPVLDELATEYKGRINIYKVNIDEHPELATAFGVKSLPTLLFIPTDNVPEITEGAPAKAELIKIFDDFLLSE